MSNMLELTVQDQENYRFNRKQRITVDFLRDAEAYLERFEINRSIIQDSISLVYRYLRFCNSFPHNLYKYCIAACYIIERHPKAFPKHESKELFCDRFGIKSSSLDYTVEKLVDSLGLIKILDDRNFPYFVDPSRDMLYKIIYNIVRDEVEKAHLDFLIRSQPVNSQFICEDITTDLVFDQEMFPEELFRQFYEMVHVLVEDEFERQGYNDFMLLQEKFLL